MKKIFLVSITENANTVDERAFADKTKAAAYLTENFKAYLNDYEIGAKTVVSKDETDFLLEDEKFLIRGKIGEVLFED